MRPSSSIAVAFLIALACPFAHAQREAAPPGPRTPPTITPPRAVTADEPPPLSDAQLDQVAAIVERSVARALQAQRDAEASIRGDQPPTPSAAYPSSQASVQYAPVQAAPLTYLASYAQPANYGYLPPPPATLTYVNVQVPPGHCKQAMAHLGAKLTALGQPRIRSMALAPTIGTPTTGTVQVRTTLAQPQALLPAAMPPVAAKTAPITSSPQR